MIYLHLHLCFSTVTRFLSFHVLEHYKSGKNPLLVKSIKFIRPNVILRQKGICTFYKYMTMVMGPSSSLLSQRPTTRMIPLMWGIRFVLPVGTLTANM